VISNVQWTRTPVRLAGSPEAIRAGLEALGLHSLAWAYAGAHLTDGYIERDALPMIWPMLSPDGRDAERLAERLVSAGLWEPTPDGWTLVGFLPMNRTRAQVERRSAAAAIGGRASGKARRETAKKPDQQDDPSELLSDR
jgi:hypothetical protein